MISTILLLPHADTRERLLADGACGARPPLMRRGSVCGYESHRRWTEHDERDLSDCYMCRNGQEYALVLARDGAVVPEGVDRLARVSPPVGSMGDRLVAVLLGRDEWGIRREYAAHLLSLLGTLVLLDADGHEVSGV